MSASEVLAKIKSVVEKLREKIKSITKKIRDSRVLSILVKILVSLVVISGSLLFLIKVKNKDSRISKQFNALISKLSSIFKKTEKEVDKIGSETPKEEFNPNSLPKPKVYEGYEYEHMKKREAREAARREFAIKNRFIGVNSSHNYPPGNYSPAKGRPTRVEQKRSSAIAAATLIYQNVEKAKTITKQLENEVKAEITEQNLHPQQQSLSVTVDPREKTKRTIYLESLLEEAGFDLSSPFAISMMKSVDNPNPSYLNGNAKKLKNMIAKKKAMQAEEENRRKIEQENQSRLELQTTIEKLKQEQNITGNEITPQRAENEIRKIEATKHFKVGESLRGSFLKAIKHMAETHKRNAKQIPLQQKSVNTDELEDVLKRAGMDKRMIEGIKKSVTPETYNQILNRYKSRISAQQHSSTPILNTEESTAERRKALRERSKEFEEGLLYNKKNLSRQNEFTRLAENAKRNKTL